MIVETMNYEDIIKTIENDVEKELHRRRQSYKITRFCRRKSLKLWKN